MESKMTRKKGYKKTFNSYDAPDRNGYNLNPNVWYPQNVQPRYPAWNVQAYNHWNEEFTRRTHYVFQRNGNYSHNNRPPSYPPPNFQRTRQRSPSPLPGTEEYTQRNIQQASDLIKKQLNLELSGANLNSDNSSKNIPSTKTSNALEKCNNISKNNLSSSSGQESSSKRTPKSKKNENSRIKPTQPENADSTINVEDPINVVEIHNKIIKQISKMSHTKKVNLVNQGSSRFDLATHQIQKQKRLELSRALRDMSTKSIEDISDCEVINSIIPDIGIKIEDLPRAVIAQLSDTLHLDIEQSSSTYFPLVNNLVKNEGVESSFISDDINSSCDSNQFNSTEENVQSNVVPQYPRLKIRTDLQQISTPKEIFPVNYNFEPSTNFVESYPSSESTPNSVAMPTVNNSISLDMLPYTCVEVTSESCKISNISPCTIEPVINSTSLEVFPVSEIVLPAPDPILKNEQEITNEPISAEISLSMVEQIPVIGNTAVISNNIAHSNEEIHNPPKSTAKKRKRLKHFEHVQKTKVQKVKCKSNNSISHNDLKAHQRSKSEEVAIRENNNTLKKSKSENDIHHNINVACLKKSKPYKRKKVKLSQKKPKRTYKKRVNTKRLSIETQTDPMCIITISSEINCEEDIINKMFEIDNEIQNLTKLRQTLYTQLLGRFNNNSNNTINTTPNQIAESTINNQNKLDMSKGSSNSSSNVPEQDVCSSEENDITINCEEVPTNFTGWSGSILIIKVVENVVVAGNDMGNIYCYDINSEELKSSVLLSHRPITSICTNQAVSDNIIHIGSLDRKVYILDFKNYTIRKSYKIDDPIQCMEMSWGYLFIGSSNGNLIRFDLKNEKVSESNQLTQSSIFVLRAAQEGARRVLLVATRNSPVTIRDAMTGLLMRTMADAFNPTIYTLLLHNNNIYCGTSQHGVLAYDFHTGELLKLHEKKISAVICMNIYKNLLFIGCYNGHIYVYNVDTHKYIMSITGPGGLFLSMEISGEKVIAGTKENHFQAWNLPKSILKEIC